MLQVFSLALLLSGALHGMQQAQLLENESKTAAAQVVEQQCVMNGSIALVGGTLLYTGIQQFRGDRIRKLVNKDGTPVTLHAHDVLVPVQIEIDISAQEIRTMQELREYQDLLSFYKKTCPYELPLSWLINKKMGNFISLFVKRNEEVIEIKLCCDKNFSVLFLLAQKFKERANFDTGDTTYLLQAGIIIKNPEYMPRYLDWSNPEYLHGPNGFKLPDVDEMEQKFAAQEEMEAKHASEAREELRAGREHILDLILADKWNNTSPAVKYVIIPTIIFYIICKYFN